MRCVFRSLALGERCLWRKKKNQILFRPQDLFITHIIFYAVAPTLLIPMQISVMWKAVVIADPAQKRNVLALCEATLEMQRLALGLQEEQSDDFDVMILVAAAGRVAENHFKKKQLFQHRIDKRVDYVLHTQLPPTELVTFGVLRLQWVTRELLRLH